MPDGNIIIILAWPRRRRFTCLHKKEKLPHSRVYSIYCLVIKSSGWWGWIEWFRETGFTPGNTPKPDDDRSYFIRDLYPMGGCGWKRWMGWFWLVILIKPKNSGRGQEEWAQQLTLNFITSGDWVGGGWGVMVTGCSLPICILYKSI